MPKGRPRISASGEYRVNFTVAMDPELRRDIHRLAATHAPDTSISAWVCGLLRIAIEPYRDRPSPWLAAAPAPAPGLPGRPTDTASI